ncbi:MAG: superoxide dismutase, partial [Ilumatobacteraceae bacterium]|nr:superoxide dismutase [Ilumatobacteraceae bacterium]
LSRSLAFQLSGHVLHSIFWTNMSPDGGGRPEGELAAAIDEVFGDFDSLQAQLTAATTSVQCIGWGALAWEPVAGRLIVEQIYDHQGNVGAGSVPLLVIDSWEHAYYLQYKNVKADWVKAFWQIVNWPNVAERFAAARTIPPTI